MKTIIIFKKHIHSSCSSFSSNDEWMSQEFESDWQPSIDLDENTFGGHKPPKGESVKEIAFNSDPLGKIDLIYAYVQADKTFYDPRLGFRADNTKVPGWKALIDGFLSRGWSLKVSDEVAAVQKRIGERNDALYAKKRAADGFVIPVWSRDIPPAGYRGALSESLFLQPYLQKYLTGGGCHGYIGAPERTHATDERLESLCKDRGISEREMAVFMCHSRGRHFADQLNGPDDVNTYLDGYLPSRAELAEG